MTKNNPASEPIKVETKFVATPKRSIGNKPGLIRRTGFFKELDVRATRHPARSTAQKL